MEIRRGLRDFILGANDGLELFNAKDAKEREKREADKFAVSARSFRIDASHFLLEKQLRTTHFGRRTFVVTNKKGKICV